MLSSADDLSPGWQTPENDVPEIARTMIRHYGDRAAELMEDRVRNCRRLNELASADFWDLVGQEVLKMQRPIGGTPSPH